VGCVLSPCVPAPICRASRRQLPGASPAASPELGRVFPRRGLDPRLNLSLLLHLPKIVRRFCRSSIALISKLVASIIHYMDVTSN
jgi:hypothetical protein